MLLPVFKATLISSFNTARASAKFIFSHNWVACHVTPTGLGAQLYYEVCNERAWDLEQLAPTASTH